jgi:F-type H+-transporting ATPase subunit a
MRGWNWILKWLSAAGLLVGLTLATRAAEPGAAVHGAAEAAGAAHAEETLPLAAPILLGWFKTSSGVEFVAPGQVAAAVAAGQTPLFAVTNSMVAMGLVALGLIIFAQLATRNVKMVPSGLQNFGEWIIESLQDFLGGILGPKLVKQTFWYFATAFLFILSANWFGLLPGVGTVGYGLEGAHGFEVKQPLLRGANADLNMTLALAVGFFAMWIIWSVRSNGVGGFFAHIFLYRGEATGGMKLLLLVMFFLVGFLEVISILIRPVSLTFRLFGNVYAGESLLETMLHKGGFLAALPFYGLELMVGAIQALVFTLLTAVFTSLMCTHDEEHAEGAGAGEGGHH